VLSYFGRILRGLVATTLGVGGGTGLLVFIVILTCTNVPNPFEFGLRAGMIIGLSFALIFFTVFLLLDLTAHLFLAKGSYKGVWDLEQSRDFSMEGNLKEVAAASRRALLTVPCVTTVQEDMEKLVMHGRTGKSWRSPGEELDLQINSLPDKKWNIKCTSRCPGNRVVFDYGKNFENVEAWQKQMKLIAEGHAKPY
jgi:hypothetical protein